MKKVLIVDDEPTILLSLSHLLSSPSVSVITTGKIEEAEEALHTHQIDLVIADIRLSGVYGFEGLQLLEHIKAHSPAPKVIIMTAYSTPEMKEAAYANGAYHYYEKPLDINDLLDKAKDCGIPVTPPKKQAKNLRASNDFKGLGGIQGSFPF
ncbi:MAG: response regulator [Nitrospiraceae bacterium]|nr:response regulator [Nitrospiraceae bacterium]